MSAVKRASSTEDPQLVLKKVKKSATALDELSEFGQLTQEDVVYYQKEAIYRILNLFRHKNRRLKKDLDDLAANYSKIHKYYSLLNNWWSEVIENFKNFDVVDSTDSIAESLLVGVDESDDDAIAKDLHQKKLKMIGLLQPLLSKPVSNREEKTVLLTESLANLNIFKSQLEDENKLLKDKIEELNQELDQFITAKDRSESKTLSRLSDNSKKDVKEELPEVKQEIISTELNDADKQVLEDLKVELSGLKTKNNILSEKLEERSAKVAQLDTSLINMSNKIANLTEQDLQQCSIYQVMLNKNLELSSELSKVKFNSSKIESEFSNLESTTTAYQKSLEAKLKAELDSNNTVVAKLETDLNRIRSDRDELNAKLSILKAEKGKSELVEEYQQLNKILEDRIQALESKFKDVEIDSDSINDLETLKKQNKILSNELKQLEDAFKQTRQLANNKLTKYSESDALINKLTAEKNKADQKYFQAMRSKDSLTSQNKILTLNLSKQTDLIESLKTNEKNLLKKLEIETAIFEKLRDLESKYQKDLSFQTNKTKELEIKFKSIQQNNGELQAKLIQKQDALNKQEALFSELKSTNQSQQSKIASLESLLTKYRTNNPSTTQDEEINQALLVMTKCQLCNKNFKNVALKVCGHCFCLECINDRLNSRMRKCPNCNKQFSSYDTLNIHL
ncbi:hypothetical protein CANARDRAFT_9713 [[Candida] arabinofermentans NRRL YB-2248]|uniref:E3 ubiquitin protein ligase n=1 Tax=[Candida] arabinofermentans NRRL YB-2248 TaxID=983967 RepID=A0A1E4SUW3_9ASCO|nr:hypothetical protein CANARDRAFT_9713 [[Candida] arabinofermentans NRRL YB-2248]